MPSTDNKSNIFSLPNDVTLIRTFLFPVIWFFALSGNRVAVGALVTVCLITDFLDGLLARKMNRETSFGAKLDSFADNIMLLSFVFWVFLVLPEVWHDYRLILLVIFGLICLVLFIMLVKFRRNVEIHTHLSKLGVSIMWTFFVYSTIISFNIVFFWAFVISSAAFLLEDAYLLITREELDEHEKGLLF